MCGKGGVKLVKKLIVPIVLIISVFVTSVPLYATGRVEFNKSNLSKGIVGVRLNQDSGRRIKFLVTFGDQMYQYNIRKTDHFQWFPFQLGNGQYTIGVYENVEGTRFTPLVTETVNIKLDDTSRVFLNSIQLINWSDRMNTVTLARELTQDMTTENEKIEVIYQYMVQQFRYDFDKVQNLTYDYIPVIDEVVRRKLGICYDYSAVFASMLRSLGIRTKLVMGFTKNVKEFHAWNEVFMDDKWVVVDTTFDSAMFAARVVFDFEKPREDYTISFIY